nr:MAG TPA: hypothetical protein [Caudoviricetes sp.]
MPLAPCFMLASAAALSSGSSSVFVIRTCCASPAKESTSPVIG